MAEITAGLMVIGVLLAIVTVVGHGIWVALAAIFGTRHPSKPFEAKFDAPRWSGGPRSCPRCGSTLAANKNACALCSWPVPTPTQATPAALEAVREHVERLARLGLVDNAAQDHLIGAIRAEADRLTAARATGVAGAEHREGATSAELRTSATGSTGEGVTGSASAAPAAVEKAATELAAEQVIPAPVGEVPAVPPAQPAPYAPVGGPASTRERALKFVESRAAAAAEEAKALAEPVAHEAVPPPPRREALSRLLAGFMEEKNIRWGELVGGLLIVGCSIALVISFWSQIAERPLLKFVLLNGVTAALFGVGLYTDRRWKIHTTSFGVLVIATLLVPLNFLAIAAFTQESPPTDVLSLLGEAFSLVTFTLLVYFAGRILVGDNRWLLAAGVMIPSLMQLVVRRFAEPTTPLVGLYALAGMPIATYLVVNALAAGRWREGGQHTVVDHTAPRVFTFLGLVSFATLPPLALLGFKVPPLMTTAHWLSPLVSLAGLPALVIGLLFWRSRRLATGLQTAGIAVGVLGAMVIAGAVVLAWPVPATLLPTALVTALVLGAVALWFGIPAAYVPAGVGLAVAWLIGFHLVRGNVEWTTADARPVMEALLSAASGHALAPLVVLFGAATAWLRRRWVDTEFAADSPGATGFASADPAAPVEPEVRELGPAAHSPALMLGIVTALTAVASIGLLLWFGFARAGDPQHVTWTLGLYAIGAFVAAVVTDQAAVCWTASLLLAATAVQGIVFRWGADWQLERPRLTALLAFATLAVALDGGLRWWSRRRHLNLLRALEWPALVATLGVAFLMATSLPSALGLTTHLAWLASLWLVLSALARWPVVGIASQMALLLAIMCGVTAAVEGRGWYLAARHPWLEPWFLEAQGIALAGYCLLMIAVRRRWRPIHALRTSGWAVATPVEIGLAVLLAVVAIYAAMPGTAQEMEPLRSARGESPAVRVVTPIEQFETAGIAHGRAADRGGWALLTAVAAVMAVGLWERSASWRLIGLLVAAAAVCPLLAVRWESDVAVASALRWATAVFFALVSAVIWTRHRWGGGWLADPRTARTARDFLVGTVLFLYVALGAYVALSALSRMAMPSGMAELWLYALLWAVVAGAVAIATSAIAARRAPSGERASWEFAARDSLLLLAGAPVAVLLTFAVARALDQHPVVGPEPASWFRRIGWDVSYGTPLAIIALTFVGYAIRERSSRFAFAAGLLLNVIATIVVLLRLARGGVGLDAAGWIMVAQVNAIVSGAVALAWLAMVARYRTALAEPAAPVATELLAPGSPLDASWPLLLVTQAVLAVALCGMFLLPAVANLVQRPANITWATSADGALGWLAVALAAAAAVWINGRRTISETGVGLLVAALVALVALTAARWDTGNWLAYHALLAGCCVAAWLLPLAMRAMNRVLLNRTPHDHAADSAMLWSAPVARLFGVAAVVLAIWGYDSDPASPWWTLAALAAIGARNLWIAWHESSRGSVWIAAILLIPAASMLWLDWAKQFSSTTGPGEASEFVWWNVLAAAALALVSLWIERRRIGADSAASTDRGVAFHRFAAWAIAIVLLGTTAAGLLGDLFDASFEVNLPLGWAAWAAAVVVALACNWDPAIRWPVACMYCVGLIGVGLYLDGLDFQAPMFHWALALALAAYSLGTSGLWSVRDRLRAVAVQWGMPAADATASGPQNRLATGEYGGHGWLVTMNLLLGCAVLLLVAWIEMSLDVFERRMVAAYAIGAQVIAIALLARGTVRTPLQYLSLLWGVMFAVALGWAFLPPDFPAPWLHRLVVTVAAMAAMVVLYGFGLVKFLRRENEWTRAAARLVPPLATTAVALILGVLWIETASYVRGTPPPVHWAATLAIGLALVGLAVAALLAALLPGRDPLGLSERGRTLYVYVAEALAALLFLHIRVTMPWLFSGWFLQFWPLVVMVIAFIGVGLGEVFRRRQQRVLWEPLENTGALLPVLPALGFWVMSSEVNYSLLLLAIGVLYAALSVMRRSFLYGMLAAFAANGSLWYLLYRGDGLGPLEHPQMWLIPPALSLLAAGYINRERLTAEQMSALRYFAAIVIYVSSTADVFINGVADAPWLPAVLAGLSIAGVLAGIVLRVRAFLYLGTAFLVVALMTVIWHAAEQHTWIWWVAGIITGVAIIALFGLFEKRRDDVLRVVEELKHWEA